MTSRDVCGAFHHSERQTSAAQQQGLRWEGSQNLGALGRRGSTQPMSLPAVRCFCVSLPREGAGARLFQSMWRHARHHPQEMSVANRVRQAHPLLWDTVARDGVSMNAALSGHVMRVGTWVVTDMNVQGCCVGLDRDLRGGCLCAHVGVGMYRRLWLQASVLIMPFVTRIYAGVYTPVLT